jgi:hypothetical protein
MGAINQYIMQNGCNPKKVGAFGTHNLERYFCTWLYQLPNNPIRTIPHSMTQTLSSRNQAVVFTRQAISSLLPMSRLHQLRLPN